VAENPTRTPAQMAEAIIAAPAVAELEPLTNDELLALAELHRDLLAAAQMAKEYLVPDLIEPGRTVFWKLVDAIREATGGAA